MIKLMKGKTMGRVLALLGAAALTVSLAAAKGPSKPSGGKTTNKTGNEVCSVTPNPVQNGTESFTVNGTGFVPNLTLDIKVGGAMFLFSSSDGSGNFAASAWASFSQTGTKSVEVYQMGDRRETLLASCSFVVN